MTEFFEGVRELALREFGLMAPAVFRAWGIRRTDDFGEIVFNLIGAGLMDPTAADDRGAFRDRFDLDAGLTADYRIEAGDGLEGPGMKPALLRLLICAVLFAGWLGYLGYLAAVSPTPSCYRGRSFSYRRWT